MIEVVAQWVAGFFLGIVGLILMGDFRAWYKLRYPNAGEADAGAFLMLLLYVGALAVIRWLR